MKNSRIRTVITAVVITSLLSPIAANAEERHIGPVIEKLNYAEVVDEPEPEPQAVGAVSAILAAIALGYNVAYNEGVAQAASGGLTWSEWNGAKGWAISIGAQAIGGLVALTGFRQGFVTECQTHAHCFGR